MRIGETKADYLYRQAIKAGRRLKGNPEGERLATDLGALIRSHRQSRKLNSDLHGDNMVLRDAVKVAGLHGRDVGVKEAAEIVLAMIEAPGVTHTQAKALTAALDNIRLIMKLPEEQRIAL